MYKIAILLLFITISSCSKSYKYFYKELGRLDCECAKVLEEGIYQLRTEPRDSLKEDSLSVQYDLHLQNYKNFVNEHWDLEEEIKSQFTEEEALEDYLKGYKDCNCDTCMFNRDFLAEPKKKEKKKSITKSI